MGFLGLLFYLFDSMELVHCFGRFLDIILRENMCRRERKDFGISREEGNFGPFWIRS